MNKKKILVLAMTLSMVAILAIGGTIAYFTDTDTETNTFTMGNVKIDLVEIFDEDEAVLKPGSQTTNKIEKQVWIENLGSEPAFVWYEWLIPTALDSTDGSTGLNNILHVNSNGYTWDKYAADSKYWPEGQEAALPQNKTWDHDPEVELGLEKGPQGYFEPVTIDGIQYNKYVVLYHGELAASDGVNVDKTTVAMNGVYMDSKVDYDNENKYYTINGEEIDFDFENDDINIIVNAYGIQSNIADQDGDGDVDVYDAYLLYNK